jgi:hypothetical protein
MNLDAGSLQLEAKVSKLDYVLAWVDMRVGDDSETWICRRMERGTKNGGE